MHLRLIFPNDVHADNEKNIAMSHFKNIAPLIKNILRAF